ncbi:ROK family protein [Actinoplanes sp. NPDC048796]|uniref:ROK family protein n=1 Tax=Actinoplanes sp. NPDC048796 TaxID=3155640 RepID=UPI00340088A8
MTTRSNQLLGVVHAHPGVTRADAARLLGIGTGATTELVARLSQAHLLAEVPARPSGSRGRPTTVLVPHSEGPLVLAAEITHEGWRLQVTELGGAVLTTIAAGHAPADRPPAWPEVVAAVHAAIGRLREQYPGRLRALGVSVPGTVSRSLRLDATNVGWHDVDLTSLWPSAADAGPTPVFVAGNDASLAAAAESARGAATGARVALHLLIAGGLGGAVVDQGRLLNGASGFAGEFGHMPFGDPAIPCPCGAHGCWGTAVDGTALARHLGHRPPRDPVTYARRVIATAADPDARAGGDGGAERVAVRAVAATLGRGIAGLVNALDADLVTLGGVGAQLLAAAEREIQTSYRAGLMEIRRSSPPPIVAAALGADGPIAGAAEEAWSSLIPRLA